MDKALDFALITRDDGLTIWKERVVLAEIERRRVVRFKEAKTSFTLLKNLSAHTDMVFDQWVDLEKDKMYEKILPWKHKLYKTAKRNPASGSQAAANMNAVEKFMEANQKIQDKLKQDEA